MSPSLLEVEDKYDVGDDVELPALAGLPGVASVETSEHQLAATYFDTGDLRLAAAGLTLRRRTGGDDAGWHLKLPTGGGRHEVQLPLGDDATTVPEPLRATVPAFAREQPLVPVATLRTQRTLHRLLDADGHVLADVCDDRVAAELPPGADGAPPVRGWREWEVELVQGDQGLLATTAALLQAAGAHPSRAASKLARALGDRLVAQDDAKLPRRRKKDSAEGIVHARLAEQVAELRRRDPIVRRDLEGGVHDMRVAIRRLRSALATYRPLLDRDVTEPLRDELQWVATSLGAARDTEVLRERLSRRLDGLADAGPGGDIHAPARDRLESDLAAQYRAAHAEAVSALESGRYFALLDRLDALVASPPWRGHAHDPVREVLTKELRRDWRRLAVKVTAARREDDPLLRAALLHDVRKAAKRVRYAAEPLVPVYGEDAARFVEATKRIQTVLGDHHDTVEARAQLRQLADLAAGDNAVGFTYGILHAQEEADASGLEADFATLWREVSKKKQRAWLS